MSAPHVILASMSPRRRDLLSRLGIPFTVQPAHLDEDALEASFTGPATGLALHLATHKAAAIAASLQGIGADTDHIILAADTTVILNGAILGKPRDTADAWSMLTRLRDRAHLVCTGVAIVATASGQQLTRAITTPVTMRAYTDDEIAAYIASGDPFDKAGSYAIQDPTFRPVARIVGCATNVIGLPLCVVAPMLHILGAFPTPPPAPDPLRHTCPWDARCLPAIV